MDEKVRDVISFFDAIAPYYDRITRMSGFNHVLWSSYLIDFFRRYASGNRLLDISIGTGLLAKHFLDRGFDVYGMDISEGMLEKAEEKGFRGRLVRGSFMKIPFGNGLFDIVISTFDSLNTVLYGVELQKIFSDVHRVLKEGGVFIFDMNTPHSYRFYWNGLERIDEDEELMVLWRSYTRGAITTLNLDILVRVEENMYRRFSGVLRERGYPLDRIEKFLRRAGFKNSLCFEHMTFRKCVDSSMRFQFVAFK